MNALSLEDMHFGAYGNKSSASGSNIGNRSPRRSPLRRPLDQDPSTGAMPSPQRRMQQLAGGGGGPWGGEGQEHGAPSSHGGGGGGGDDKKMGLRTGALGAGQGTMNQGNSILGRRSTKVHAPPGGHSSFSFGGGD
jgi:hypothetical protein